MRTAVIAALVVFYCVHLMISAGAGYVAVRLWRFRSHPLIWRIVLYLHGLIIDAVAAIVLIFLARGTKWNWPFTIVFFTARLLEDAVRLPLIVYLIAGPGEIKSLQGEASGDLPPDFWSKEFRQAVRDVMDERDMKN